MVPGVGAKLAVRWVGSSATAPAGLPPGAPQVRVKEAAPVSGAMVSLKAAVTEARLRGTPVVLAAGVTTVTWGRSAATPLPRTGDRLPPQPAVKAVSTRVMDPAMGVG